MTVDHSYLNFIEEQARAAASLTSGSGRVRLVPEPGQNPPRVWLAQFDCKTLVRRPNADVEVVDGCAVAFRFPEDYLARVDSFEILRWVGPEHRYHPNIHPVAPVLCVGLLYPAMSLLELIHQIHQVVTWRNVTLVESDALNRDACAWARSHPDRYPVDDRPLRGASSGASAGASSRFVAQVRDTQGKDGDR